MLPHARVLTLPFRFTPVRVALLATTWNKSFWTARILAVVWAIESANAGDLATGFLMDDHPDCACTSREVNMVERGSCLLSEDWLIRRKVFLELSWDHFSHYLETQEHLELKEIFKHTSLFYEWRIWDSGRQGRALLFVVLHKTVSSPAIQRYQPACFPFLLGPAPQPCCQLTQHAPASSLWSPTFAYASLWCPELNLIFIVIWSSQVKWDYLKSWARNDH